MKSMLAFLKPRFLLKSRCSGGVHKTFEKSALALARARGDRGCVDYVKGRKRELDAQGMVTRQEAEAAEAFNAAHDAARRRAARPV